VEDDIERKLQGRTLFFSFFEAMTLNFHTFAASAHRTAAAAGTATPQALPPSKIAYRTATAENIDA
jgi:hypothetical protein